MKGPWRIAILALLTLVALPTPTRADVVDFDGFSDLDSITTEIAGLTFTNTTVLTAGISLNEFEFPPLSGANVVFDDGGSMTIVFDDSLESVGGFFTYLVPITFSAFDVSNNLVGTDTSNFSSNLALSGDSGSSPNEFLGVNFPGGIIRITIQGDVLGSSLTLDDLTFTPLSTAVPEPATLLLLGAGFSGLLGWRAVRRVGGCDK